jgi:hypothetical protein
MTRLKRCNLYPQYRIDLLRRVGNNVAIVRSSEESGRHLAKRSWVLFLRSETLTSIAPLPRPPHETLFRFLKLLEVIMMLPIFLARLCSSFHQRDYRKFQIEELIFWENESLINYNWIIIFTVSRFLTFWWWRWRGEVSEILFGGKLRWATFIYHLLLILFLLKIPIPTRLLLQTTSICHRV